MSKKRRKRTKERGVCRGCGLAPERWEIFPGGTCPSCLDRLRQERRARTGSRLLARAHHTGIEHRDGSTFDVVTLPPQRR